MAKRPALKLFKPEEIKRSIAPLADQLPSTRPPSEPRPEPVAQPEMEPEILPPEPASVEDYVQVIDRLWDEAQKGFLTIGRYLEQAQETLAADEFARLVGRLRFGKAVRSQIMTAYRAVRTGSVPPDLVASGYSVVYQIANLNDAERRQAMADGVIRPGVRRQDIVKFRARYRAGLVSQTEAKRAELRRLLAEQERLAARIAVLRDELAGDQEE